MEDKSKETDIYIHPSMSDFSVLDFNQGNKIMRLGETTARQKYVALKSLSISQNNKNQTLKLLPRKILL